MHHSELVLTIPSTFTLTINQTEIGNHAKVHTLVASDKITNLTGIVAEDFDEKNVNFNRQLFLVTVEVWFSTFHQLHFLL